MRHRILIAAAATLAALAAVPVIPAGATPTTDHTRVQAAVARFEARQAAGLGRVVLTREPATGETLAADFEYACNPSATAWNTKAAWASGTVLEDRQCLREDDLGDVRTFLYARTRRGGTAIKSDWDFDDPVVEMWVHSYTTDKNYGVKNDDTSPGFNDIFGTSFVQVANYPDCSTVAGNDLYAGFIINYQANPYGTDAKSGEKDESTASQTNSFLDCGHQS